MAALRPGEQIVWHGQPAQGLRVYPLDYVMLVVWLGWAAICLFMFWIIMAGEVWWGALFPLAFLGVGTWRLVYPFFWDRRRRASTWYALTASRALILEAFQKPQLLSLELHALHQIGFIVRMDGSGTIAFGVSWPESPSIYRDYHGRWPYRGLAPAFEQIEDVRRVHADVMKLKWAKSAMPTSPHVLH